MRARCPRSSGKIFGRQLLLVQQIAPLRGLLCEVQWLAKFTDPRELVQIHVTVHEGKLLGNVSLLLVQETMVNVHSTLPFL